MLAPQIDPIIFTIGPIPFIDLSLPIRWYSLMYVIGLVTVYYYFKYSSQKGTLKATTEQIDNILAVGMIGMILGARIIYVTVYNWDQYAAHPLSMFAVWQGGLSFHGALLGICIGIYLYAKKAGLSFFRITDHISVVGPIGLFFGRIGNFINGELYGRVTDSPFGMIFPGGGPNPRHPSQLYESLSEGLLLLIIINLIRRKNPKIGVLSGTFVMGYGLIRFVIEFFREPDAQLGFIFGPFSMGQILCSIMWVVGAFIIMYAKSQDETFYPKAIK